MEHTKIKNFLAGLGVGLVAGISGTWAYTAGQNSSTVTLEARAPKVTAIPPRPQGPVTPEGSPFDFYLTPHSPQAKPAPIPSAGKKTMPVGFDESKIYIARRSLRGFDFPTELELRSALSLEEGKQYEEATRHLLANISNKLTSKERATLDKKCDQVIASYDPKTFKPTTSNLSCLYSLLQKLQKDEEKLLKEHLSGNKQADVNFEEQRRKFQKIEREWQKPNFPKTVEQWSLVSEFDYNGNMELLSFTSLEKVNNLALLAVEGLANCKTSAGAAALMRNLEDFLPNEEAWARMNQVYERITPCLKNDDDAFETVHGRMALLYLQKHDILKAGKSLELALTTAKPSEEASHLYWRGYIESMPQLVKPKGKLTQNIYWNMLIENYPLDLHALVADAAIGEHSFQRLKAKPIPEVALFEGVSWERNNLTMFIFTLLNSRKDTEGLRRFSNYTADRIFPKNFETGLALALSHLKSQNVRICIATIFSLIKDFGSEKFNSDMLALMYPTYYKTEVLKYAGNTDPTLIFALIRQESSFNPKATSPVGARGLMQVMPGTARHIYKTGSFDLYNPQNNIKIGSKYLSILLNKYDGSYVSTIASYNAGSIPVLRWQERYPKTDALLFADLIPYPETRHYVSILLRNMHWYGEILNHREEGDFNFGGSSKENTTFFPTKAWTASNISPTVESFGLKIGERVPELAFDKPYTKLLSK